MALNLPLPSSELLSTHFNLIHFDIGMSHNSSIVRRKYRYIFTSTEDQLLEAAIERLGRKDWDAIAQHLPGRSPRQCRERWISFLSPDVNRMPWTPEEDGLLFDLLQTHGPKWGALVTFFRNRTQNNIKNRWNTVVRKARALGRDPATRICFIETGQKIVSRSTRTHFAQPKEILAPTPQQLYSLGNLLNSNVSLG
jgi:hypothetical protein